MCSFPLIPLFKHCSVHLALKTPKRYKTRYKNVAFVILSLAFRQPPFFMFYDVSTVSGKKLKYKLCAFMCLFRYKTAQIRNVGTRPITVTSLPKRLPLPARGYAPVRWSCHVPNMMLPYQMSNYVTPSWLPLTSFA